MMKLIGNDDVFNIKSVHHIYMDKPSYHTLEIYSEQDVLEQLRGHLYKKLVIQNAQGYFFRYKPVRYINHSKLYRGIFRLKIEADRIDYPPISRDKLLKELI